MARRPVRIRRNSREVGRFLQSAAMQAACRMVAERYAARARAGAGDTPYDALDVRVETTAHGGVRGDRAQAMVVIAAPPPERVRYPDTARFRLLARLGRGRP